MFDALNYVLGPYLLLLLKFGIALRIIRGFLMAVSCWRHRLQCIVIMQCFLRLLKLHKLAENLISHGGGVLLGVTVC